MSHARRAVSLPHRPARGRRPRLPLPGAGGAPDGRDPGGAAGAASVGIFSAVFLVGNALGSMVFGYVAHGLGYAVMWGTLTVLLVAGFALSFRLRVGYARRAPRAI